MPAVYDTVKARDHESLLRALADGHSVNESSTTWTPLFELVNGPWHKDKPMILQTLLEHGANTEIRCGYTTALVSLAFPRYRVDNVAWIGMISMLINYGADMNAGDPRILYTAARYGKLQLVDLLCTRGAEIDFDNYSYGDNTPLQIAAHYGHVAVARCLVRHGACTVRRNLRWFTAGDLARSCRSPWHREQNDIHTYEEADAFGAELDKVVEVRRIRGLYSKNLAFASSWHPRAVNHGATPSVIPKEILLRIMEVVCPEMQVAAFQDIQLPLDELLSSHTDA
ncbi:ankyrin repeat-containing domain protein [Baffinella frigidus]|nr:ankyrin repeat-containing domain protein [Cryptophyta sp. CCMP2293]